jgi:hypothetical protein
MMTPYIIPQSDGHPIFAVKGNSPVPGGKAQEVGEYLFDLQEKMDITPHNILDDARSESSKLHEFFEWNDGTAAEQWRLQQSRKIINHLEIVVVDASTEEEVRTRAFHSIYVPKKETKEFEMTAGDNGDDNDNDEPIRTYISTVTILKQPNYHEQAIENALRELRGWQRRFNVYSELQPVFRAIEELTEMLD